MSEPDQRTANLVKECQRQFDNCLYSAAALFTWQKFARVWRAVMLIAPIVLGGFASSQLLMQTGTQGKLAGALCGVLAGIIPAVLKALNLDTHLDGLQRAANEFTNLRDRFRRAATVTSFAPFDEFKAEFEALSDRMDAARATSTPAPEWCFRRAQKKLAGGDYSFDVDVSAGRAPAEAQADPPRASG